MIEVRQLTKIFGDVPTVKDVSFALQPGELLVLVGASGSGKTTTLKMINRLIAPTSGTVFIEGADANLLVGHELRRKIGYVFQKVGLFPHMSIEQNIALPLKLAGWPNGRIQKRVDEVLELVELDTSLRNRRPSKLSGGEEQRVGVARALAAAPKLMLLDEPFGSLDPLIRSRLQQSFMKIRARVGLTAIFVTHDMVEALLLADRIAVMKDGQLIQVATPHDLVVSPGDAYVERLLELPRRQSRAFEQLMGGAARA